MNMKHRRGLFYQDTSKWTCVGLYYIGFGKILEPRTGWLVPWGHKICLCLKWRFKKGKILLLPKYLKSEISPQREGGFGSQYTRVSNSPYRRYFSYQKISVFITLCYYSVNVLFALKKIGRATWGKMIF